MAWLHRDEINSKSLIAAFLCQGRLFFLLSVVFVLQVADNHAQCGKREGVEVVKRKITQH